MTQTKPKAGVKEWLGLVVIVLVTLLVAIDISVLGFAIPPISAALHPTSAQLLWIMDIYSFVLGGTLITAGWVGDRFGRRKLLIIGAFGFGAASAVAAFAKSPEVLIGARVVLGLSGASLTPTSLALIRNMFHDQKQRKGAIAAWSGTMTSGAALGPIVGGLLLNHFWWGSVFLINVPIMVLVLILAPILLPEFRDTSRSRMDLLGAFLSMAGILPLIYGAKQLALDGYSQKSMIFVIAGAVLLVAFVIRQATTDHPLIDLSLFRSGGFSGSILVNATVMLALMGVSILTNQYMQEVLGFSPFKAALWSMAAMPAIGISIGVTAVVSRKVRPRYLIFAGLLVMATGFFVLHLLTVTSSIIVVIIGMSLMGAGLTASKTITAEIVVTSAPPEKAGSSTSISETFTEFGSAMGFALIGSIGGAVFKHDVRGLNPPGLTSAQLDAAHNTIGGAADAASHLPPAAGASFLAASRTAFTHGLQVATMWGSVGVIAVAVIASLLLRNVPIEAALPREEKDEDPTPDTERLVPAA